MMKPLASRITALAIAVALCTSSAPSAYAREDAASQTRPQDPQRRSDTLAAQSDLTTLGQAFLVGLALFEESIRATRPCSDCGGAR
jgi:hypothetical protein